MALFSDILAHLLKRIIYTYLNIYYLRVSRLKRSPFVSAAFSAFSCFSAFSVFRFHCFPVLLLSFSFLSGYTCFDVVLLAFPHLTFLLSCFSLVRFRSCMVTAFKQCPCHQACQIRPLQPFSSVFTDVLTVSLPASFRPLQTL